MTEYVDGLRHFIMTDPVLRDWLNTLIEERASDLLRDHLDECNHKPRLVSESALQEMTK